MGAISADFIVTFDPAVLTPNGAVLGTVGSSNGGGRTLNVTNPVAGNLVVSIFGGSQFAGSGSLVDFNFNVVGLPGAASPVNVATFQYNEGPPCGIINNGRVGVISGTMSGTITYGNILTPPAPRFVPGVTLNAVGSTTVSTVTDSMGAYSMGGFAASPYTITPNKAGGVNGALTAFDASRIAQYVVQLFPFNATQELVADVSGENGITSFDAVMIARYVAMLPPISVTERTGNWVFNPVSNTYPNIFANVSNENYSALLMGDVTANWNDPIPLPGGRPAFGTERAVAVKVPQMVVEADKQITIPVDIQGALDKDIVAYEFELTYDPTVIQPQAEPVDVAGTASRGLTAVANARKPGSLRVAVYGTMPINDNGVLLNLRFTAVGAPNSVSPLRWESLLLNEGSPRALPFDGQIKIAAASPNDVEISGHLLSAYGEGIANSRVTLTDPSGKTLSAVSNELGAYRFGGLHLGETYTISAASRRFIFTPLTVSVADQAVNVDMIAEP